MTYVGVRINAVSKRMFRSHLLFKGDKANQMAHSILGMRSSLRDLTPSIAIGFYMSLVDPHLIHGADVMVEDSIYDKGYLASIQVNFLRRLLRVQSRSFKAPLFLLTGMIPVEARRISLGIQAISSFTAMSDQTLVAKAVAESLQLGRLGVPTWLQQIKVQVQSRTGHWLTDDDMYSMEILSREAERVKLAAVREQCVQVLTSNQTIVLHPLASEYLVSIDRSTALPDSITCHPSLAVTSNKRRTHLLRFFLGHMSLRIHAGRIRDPVLHRSVAREVRMCRLGCQKLEDEIHLIFKCVGTPAFISLRSQFKTRLRNKYPAKFEWPLHVNGDDVDLLQKIHLWTGETEICKEFMYFLLLLLETLDELVT